MVRYRGSHVFNPSNVGLVVAFLLLGSTRIEPLDFWWAPLNVPMIAAYAVIVVGGLLITRRLHLLVLAVTFWLSFAIGIGVLAASGHCMVARWSFAPVCGFDFWRVIVISPEVLIFLFFMITDPKTAPAGRVARVVFGILVALASHAPDRATDQRVRRQGGPAGGLVLLCAVRPILDRLMPEARTAADDIGAFATTAGGQHESPARGSCRAIGTGQRWRSSWCLPWAWESWPPASRPGASYSPNVAEAWAQVPHQIDPATLPTITVGQDVADWDHQVAGPEMQGIVLTLAENLELESQALLRRDPQILTAVDHGDRLAQMQERLTEAKATGTTVVARYQFDSLDVRLLVPFGMQTGLSLGFDGRGTLTTVTYDADGTAQAVEVLPLLADVRDAAGDGSSLAQRGRPAHWIRRLVGIRGLTAAPDGRILRHGPRAIMTEGEGVQWHARKSA